MDDKDYPLHELVKIKEKRFDQAVKFLEEKKAIYKKELELLRKIEKERDEVLRHKEDKLFQLREALDKGENTEKIRQKKTYLEVVKEKLLEKEKKVQKQQKQLKEAEKEVEKARKLLQDRQKDIEKLKIHKKQWKKEMKYIDEQKMAAIQDEVGSIKHVMKKKTKK